MQEITPKIGLEAIEIIMAEHNPEWEEVSNAIDTLKDVADKYGISRNLRLLQIKDKLIELSNAHNPQGAERGTE